MNIVHIELRSENDIDAVQTWLDDHSTATIISTHIEGFNVYIFYTE